MCCPVIPTLWFQCLSHQFMFPFHVSLSCPGCFLLSCVPSVLVIRTFEGNVSSEQEGKNSCFDLLNSLFRLSFLSPPLHHTRRRGRHSRRQKSLVRDARPSAARRARTLRPRLRLLRRKSRNKKLASACWLPRRPPLSARTQPRRALTASKFTSPRPRLAFERSPERQTGLQ